ncbi:LacI family DNA-binding transcriptional regulator [Paenarthrobacter sp. YIM B13468]|uniref:LacI family DNA-binding transcriptional regulator n=1 Tax=Paenarthrobacter sp. YIM B13468 TaxID=3366295 RepID=UPI00366D4E48
MTGHKKATGPRSTLADVAELAGVSPTAASLILNARENTRLSEDARHRVFAAAETLNYRPNMMARGLRMEKSATIGFVSDLIATTRYAGPMIRGALRAARGETILSSSPRPKVTSRSRNGQLKPCWTARSMR